MSERSLKVLISAGEASGDMHAATVICELREIHSDIDISGISGPAMRKAGCNVLADIHELNVMGVVDVLKSLPRIRQVRQRILQWAEKERPDIAILVDFPGFHINIGRKLRRMGIPVVQYIAPKLWAWGAWRAGKLRDSQDALASILPFETDWFAQRGIKARYVGNPSAVASRSGWSRDEYMHRSGLNAASQVLAILPGSRPSELAHHIPLLAAVWAHIHRLRPDLQAVIPLVSGVDETLLEPLTKQGVCLIPRMQDDFRLYADVAVAVSGTATLELALWDVPTVLVYRTAPFTVFMARRVIRVPFIGLANLLLNQSAMPELIQEEANEERVVGEIIKLLDDKSAVQAQKSHFSRLRELLGEDDPANQVAHMAISLAEKGI
ncbi:MAG: lipid-A-disaccharide synthase [Mariprofundaceae bacterium]|nr:lipid-A-disaccharide synthase [Mariprofundaceae bacterium]